MSKYASKVKEAREESGMSQKQLAEKIGVTQRTITTYETGGSLPRGTTARKLAKALNVSLEYLMNDEIDDPRHGLEKEPFLDEVRARFGSSSANEADLLLKQNVALFAGGHLSQDAKDAFFESVMRAYLECKEEAKRKFGRKNPAARKGKDLK